MLFAPQCTSRAWHTSLALFLPIQVSGLRAGVQTSRPDSPALGSSRSLKGTGITPRSTGFLQSSAMRASAEAAYNSSDSGSSIPTTEPLIINHVLEIKMYTMPICFFFFFFGASGKEPTCQCRRHKRIRFSPWAGKIPWRRVWLTHPSILAWRIPWTEDLMGYSPGGRKESDTTGGTWHTACANMQSL